jgi:transposase
MPSLPATAPPRPKVSSGNRVIHRLSQRGNRRLNHAIHMAAVTQLRHRHSDGRAYYDKKIAEGKTGKEALRCLKRRISNTICARLRADARTAQRLPGGPGRATGERLCIQRGQLTPERQLFGSATPEPSPQPTIRASHLAQERKPPTSP